VQDEIRAYKTGATSDKNWPHSDLQELGTVIAILIRAKTTKSIINYNLLSTIFGPTSSFSRQSQFGQQRLYKSRLISEKILLTSQVTEVS
jgi:hypothetical protein